MIKKSLLVLVAVIGFGLSANAGGVNAAVQAGLNVNLNVSDLIPNSSYYLKITKNGDIAYAPISSCQMALEKTYDLLKTQGVSEVRIISESPTLNGSCRNKTYTKYDLEEVKKRRDGWAGGKI
ncbi:MAG: hypothetical protein LBN95_03655 [Prevotellaceae bacterium]|jgi:hypothetical protein|nr:hypothetical protein [Prevotellaceae bacterium]